MTIVYAVTSGSYSDYSIHGLFSTKEKASSYIENNKEELWGPGEIEEWTLDEREHYTVKTIWACDLDTKSGDLKKEWDHNKSCGSRYTKTGVGAYETWAHSSVSPEHARKLAAEARQKMLRERSTPWYKK